MTISIATARTAQKYSSGDLTFSAFTPAANSLILVSARIRNGTATSVSWSGSGNGTFTEVVDNIGLESANSEVALYACEVGSSPTSQSISVVNTSTASYSYGIVDEITSDQGQPYIAPLTGTKNTGRNVVYGGNVDDTLSATLNAFEASTNWTYVVGGQRTKVNTTDGFTQSGNLGNNIITSYKASEDTTPSVSRRVRYGYIYMVACEIGEPSGGGGSSETLSFSESLPVLSGNITASLSSNLDLSFTSALPALADSVVINSAQNESLLFTESLPSLSDSISATAISNISASISSSLPLLTDAINAQKNAGTLTKYALRFDGTNDYVSASGLAIDLTDVTFEWKGSFSTLGADKGLFQGGTSTTDGFVCWYDQPNGLKVYFRVNGVTVTNAGITGLSTNIDYQVVVRFVNATSLTVSIYLISDGSLVGTQSVLFTDTLPNLTDLYIGDNPSMFARPFDGDFYSLKITYNQTNDIHHFDADLSEGSGNALINSINTIQGSLVNFTTNDSQWVSYTTLGLEFPILEAIPSLTDEINASKIGNLDLAIASQLPVISDQVNATRLTSIDISVSGQLPAMLDAITIQGEQSWLERARPTSTWVDRGEPTNIWNNRG